MLSINKGETAATGMFRPKTTALFFDKLWVPHNLISWKPEEWGVPSTLCLSEPPGVSAALRSLLDDYRHESFEDLSDYFNLCFAYNVSMRIPTNIQDIPKSERVSAGKFLWSSILDFKQHELLIDKSKQNNRIGRRPIPVHKIALEQVLVQKGLEIAHQLVEIAIAMVVADSLAS